MNTVIFAEGETLNLATVKSVLKHIFGLAEQALSKLKKEIDAHPEIGREGINWGDLHCTNAELCIDEEGEMYMRVIIEECAPDSRYLAEYVRDYLKVNGFPGIQADCEW